MSECSEWITTQNQQLCSQWSDPGTVSDLLHQALREAWQIQRYASRQRGGWGRGGGEVGRRGAKPIPVLFLSATSFSPLHILQRAETASHAETNVKINRWGRRCSALTCPPLVKLAFQDSSQAVSSSSSSSLAEKQSTTVLHFMLSEFSTVSSPSEFFPALWSGLRCASEARRRANVAFG